MSDESTNSPTQTAVGNYFIANYPPFSFWTPEHVPAAAALLERPAPATPLGLYIHLPFCRKRCDFCYFKVYTDRDSQEIRRYLEAVLTEARRVAKLPYLRGRRPRFVYFGGGTPSYLSVPQLQTLFAGLQDAFSFDDVEEVTFEAEPGTLQEPKIDALRDLAVTRLSLGVENFSPEILELNNRAHRAKEIFRSYEYARQVGFDQINLDLIAGMVGESDANWRDCIEQTVALRPESVTIYQMELPYNTTISRQVKSGVREVPVADWDTKRRWTAEAFAAFEQAGYLVGSAYTVKVNEAVQFRYRDSLWTGADLLGLGVSSFSHLGGIHAQNEHEIGTYMQRVQDGELPLLRALPLDDEERLIREFVLQLKLGVLQRRYFQDKFGVDVAVRFRDALQAHQAQGFLKVEEDVIRLTREGLLQVDGLLPAFFLERHRGARYA